MTITIPANWDEIFEADKKIIASGKSVSETYYYRLVAILNSNISNTDAKFECVKLFSGMNGFDIGKEAGAATAKQRAAFADMAGFEFALAMMEDVFPQLDFIFGKELFTVNPLPVIEHGGVTYYGPAEKISTQCGAEMEDCCWAFAEYAKTVDVKFLNHLVASLYRPKHEAFNKKIIEQRAEVFDSLDETIKQGILFFYSNCESWYQKEYSFLYSAAPKKETPEGEPPQIDSLGVSRILRMLAGEKRGTVEQVRLMERQEIYFELSELERLNTDK